MNVSKCVYYRPEHRANRGPLKMDFNKPTDRAQKVIKKNVFICLVIMFTSE